MSFSAIVSVSLRGIAVAALLSCTGEDSTTIDITQPEPPTERLVVTVTPETDTLLLGSSTILSASLTDATGRPRPGLMAWTSSNPTVATVTGGEVTAVGTGATMVFARSGTAADSALIVVPDVPLELNVSPSAVQASLGDTIQFSATLMGPDDVSFPGGASVRWAVSDSTTAALIDNATLETRAEGDLTVYARIGQLTAEAVVRVSTPRVASISVSPVAASIYVGGTLQLTATLRDDRGRRISARVTWSSSNTSNATVNSDGLVRGVSRGGAWITARVDGRSASAAINVSSQPAVALDLTLPRDSMIVAKTMQAVATPRDADGDPVSGRTVAWQSSNPSVATITSSGQISGRVAGATTISAICDGVVTSRRLTVLNSVATAITIIPATARMRQGGTSRFSSEVRDQMGNAIANQPVAWSSLTPTVATVDTDGDVSALAPGAATIKAASGQLNASASVSVETTPVASVVVSPAAVTLQAGATAALVATSRDAGGTILSNRPVTWSSSNNGIATVSPGGIVSAIAAGLATITANVEGITATMSVTVTAPVPVAAASIAITLNSPSLNIGQTTQAVAKVLDAQGNELPGRPVVWSTSDEELATVSSSGTVTALLAGTVAIVAQREGKTGTATLVIAQPAPTSVASMLLTVPKQHLIVGESTQLAIELRDALGNLLTGRTVAFSSSRSSVVTVSVTGLVVAASAGTATITATSEGNTSSLPFTVTAPPTAAVATVSVQLASSTLASGQGTQATASMRDAAGNVLSGRAVVWGATDIECATVSATGYVIAGLSCAVQIVATSEGKSGSAPLTVTTSAPAAVSSVTVQLGTGSMAPGQGTQATAVLRDASGNTLSGRPVAWNSSNNSVATVSTSGYVSGSSAGSAQITATSEGKSGSASITVQSAPAVLSSVTIQLGSSSLVVGQNTSASVVGLDANGIQIPGVSFTWSMSAGSSVASLSSTSGASVTVTGNTAGNATVSVSGSLGGVSKTASSALTVVTAPPPPPPGNVVPPALPTLLSFTYPSVSGQTRVVQAGQDLQSVLNAAQRGDEIVLTAGATFTGNFVLPAKSGTCANGWIIIRSSQLSQLPAGVRVTPARAALMPKIRTTTTLPALSTAASASCWWIAGVEIDVDPSITAWHYGLVQFGEVGYTQKTLASVPTDLVLERSYVHGAPNSALIRAIGLNSARTSIKDSYISEAHARDNGDTQAIAGWNGPGPYQIVNNTLQAAGENIMFGGADPAIPGLVPSDIEIRRNYIYKPASWKGVWQAKNLFEMKNATRVLVEGNVFEGMWGSAQDGYAFVWWSVNQSGTAPQSKVTDITMRKNILRNSAAGFQLTAESNYSNCQQAEPLARVLIEDLLMENIHSGIYTGDANRFFVITNQQCQRRMTDIAVRRVTGTRSGNTDGTALMIDPVGATNWEWSQVLLDAGGYGYHVTGDLAVAPTFNGSTRWAQNALIGVDRDTGSGGPASGKEAGTGTTYVSSVAAGAALGAGANIAAINAATAGVVIP